MDGILANPASWCDDGSEEFGLSAESVAQMAKFDVCLVFEGSAKSRVAEAPLPTCANEGAVFAQWTNSTSKLRITVELCHLGDGFCRTNTRGTKVDIMYAVGGNHDERKPSSAMYVRNSPAITVPDMMPGSHTPRHHDDMHIRPM